jgi:pimeloyl-ACP methyl ester carboxylesterase
METKEIDVTGTVLQEVVVHALYGAETIRYMPAFLNRLIDADTVELRGWIQPDLFDWYGSDALSEGAFYAFFCSEQLPFSDPEEVEAEAARYAAYNGGGIVGSQEVVICERWPIGPINPRERHAVWSVVPTLLLSGALDPVTPPEFAHMAARDLVYGYDFVIPRAGHGPLTHSPCANAIAEEFLERPMQRPAAACLTDAR